MTTIRQLIDRLERDYLWPPSEQPPQAILSADVGSADNTVEIDTAALSDMAAELGPGITAEVNQELMLVTDWVAPSLTVDRPNPTAHTAGDRVRFAPPWARATLFDAVADAIEDLWPDLYAVKTMPMAVSGTPSWLPAPKDLADVLGYSGYDEDSWSSLGVEHIPHHPYSPTGILQFPHGFAANGYLTYKAKFTRPSSENDELDKLGVTDTTWHRIVIVAALTQAIAGRDLSRTTMEFITKALEAQGVPVGTETELRNSLLNYHRYLVDRAADRLAVATPTPMAYNRASRVGWA